jgi:hypothetical protein
MEQGRVPMHIATKPGAESHSIVVAVSACGTEIVNIVTKALDGVGKSIHVYRDKAR